jgi:hypothetical protein
MRFYTAYVVPLILRSNFVKPNIGLYLIKVGLYLKNIGLCFAKVGLCFLLCRIRLFTA